MSLNNFFNLIYNEVMKTYIRKSTWVMYIILAVLIIGFGSLNKMFMDDTELRSYGDDWREELRAENEEIEKKIAIHDEKIAAYDEKYGDSNQDEHGFDEKRWEMEMDYPDIYILEQNNLHLEKDVKPSGYGAWQFVAESSMFLSIVSLLTIIVAAGIVAHEFRWGTIKLLLIRPISRSVILLSKYISVLLFALFTLLFVLITAWLSGVVLFGLENISEYMQIYGVNENNEFVDKLVPVASQVFPSYGYGLVNLVMMTTFAFMISAIFRNSSLAIGLAIFLMLSGNTATDILAALDFPLTKYILFANTNLKQYADGFVQIKGMTLGFSIMVLIVYYVIFVGLAWFFFVRRDVTN